MKEILVKEYNERIESLKLELLNSEKELEDSKKRVQLLKSKAKEINDLERKKLELQIQSLKTKSEREIKDLESKKLKFPKPKEEIKYSVEKKFNGFHCSIHKKGDELKIFSEHKNDLTKSFPTLIGDIKKLSSEDFIVDGELVPYEKGKAVGRNVLMKFVGAVKSGKIPDDSNIRLHCWDCLYYGKPIINLPLSERLDYLSKLDFTERITNTLRKIVKAQELKQAIEWASSLEGSEGSVIKKTNESYSFGKKNWVKYRHLIEIRVKVLELNEIKAKGSLNYHVGTELRKEDLNEINPDKIIDFEKQNYLDLGNTFNTKIKANKGDILVLLIEELWRHKTKKGLHYSLHKPKVKDISSGKETDNIDRIEDIVASVGVSVTHSFIEDQEVLVSQELAEKLIVGEEGKEIEVKDFPKRMQDNFKKVMESKEWQPFVIQWHLRGQKSIHSDLRFKVNDILEGFTLFTPPSIDRPDLLTGEMKNIRGTIKIPQPIDWLKFEGRTERESPGSTKEQPSYFAIVAKGKYRPLEISDHKIVLEMKSDKGNITRFNYPKGEEYIERFNKKLPEKLKDIKGVFSYHIAHISGRHIILFDKIKPKD